MKTILLTNVFRLVAQFLVLCLNIFHFFLEWELRRRSSSQKVVHYLDDFLVAGRANTSDCVALMDCYIGLCNEIGVPLANEKR